MHININKTKNVMKQLAFFSLLFAMAVTKINAQSTVISQFQSIPLVTNAANTGNFNDSIAYRFGISYAHLTNGDPNKNYFGAITNNSINTHFDFSFGKNKKTAIGLNHMYVGSPRNVFNQNYSSISFAQVISFDKSNNYSLRLGAQAVYAQSSADQSKGGYDILLDPRGFEYYRSTEGIQNKLYFKSYVNLNLGAVFAINYDKFQFTSGVAVLNTLKPNFGIILERDSKKRIAMNFHSNLKLKISDSRELNFEHFTYREGLFFKGASLRIDSADINETIYGINLRFSKKSDITVGALTRSMKTVIFQSSIKLSKGLITTLNYELPFQHKYYPISQYGVSIIVMPNRKSIKN